VSYSWLETSALKYAPSFKGNVPVKRPVIAPLEVVLNPTRPMLDF
jgi:hypothetical protein